MRRIGGLIDRNATVTTSLAQATPTGCSTLGAPVFHTCEPAILHLPATFAQAGLSVIWVTTINVFIINEPLDRPHTRLRSRSSNALPLLLRVPYAFSPYAYPLR